jgi:hypothetical protein
MEFDFPALQQTTHHNEPPLSSSAQLVVSPGSRAKYPLIFRALRR